MNRLMRQAFDPDQIRGRESRIRVNQAGKRIAYKAPNGMVFFIDTRPVDEGGEPIVRSSEAKRYGANHKTHTLGDSQVCLADSLRGWELTRILFQCDSWARGIEIYRKTGKFPDNPGQSFSRQTSRNHGSTRTSNFFKRLLN